MSDKISQVRARFEQELVLSSSPAKYNEIDINRVRTEEWQVRRYLHDNGDDVEAAFQALIKTLAWKQSFGVHTFSVDKGDFPRELFEVMRGEVYGESKDGMACVTEAYTHQKQFKEIDTLVRQIIVGQIEKVDRLVGEKGAVYIGDFTSTPLAHLSVPLAKFRVDCLNHYYPFLARKMLLVNVPFLLKPVIKLILSFMKPSIRDAVENVSTEQLVNYIDRSVLHKELGGTREKRFYPDNAPTMREMKDKLELSDQFLEQYYKFYNSITV